MADNDMQPPAGFINVSKADEDGFYEPAAGAVVHGILLGRFERSKPGPDGRKGFYYQIALSKTCTAAVQREKDKKGNKVAVTLEPGQVLFMDERSGIKDLAAWADGGEQQEVYITCDGKIPLDNGKSYWKLKPYVREGGPSDDALRSAFPGRY